MVWKFQPAKLVVRLRRLTTRQAALRGIRTVSVLVYSVIVYSNIFRMQSNLEERLSNGHFQKNKNLTANSERKPEREANLAKEREREIAQNTKPIETHRISQDG